MEWGGNPHAIGAIASARRQVVRLAQPAARGRLAIVPPSDAYRSEAPTSPEVPLVPCPACANDGEATGDRLVQLPSGTWMRRACESCGGFGKVSLEELERFRTF